MVSDQPALPGKPSFVVDRSRLQLMLGAPFALLLAASLVSWPWRSLGLPGIVGTLTPPAVVLLVVVALGGAYAVRRGLPVGLMTWLPAGQGAIFLLTTGFLGESEGNLTRAIVVVGAYILMFIMALVVSVMVSSAGFGWGVAFMSFFVLTQVTRFPVFGAVDGTGIDNPELLTFAAFVIAAVEVVVIAWLARRLVEAADDQTTGVVFSLLLVTFAHGILTGWEEPIVSGTLTFVNYASLAGVWLAATGLQLAVAFVFIRIRHSWFQEPAWAEPQPEADVNAFETKGVEATIMDFPAEATPRRQRPRRPRRN
ncbi:MAG: hypothetical protein O2826_02105 [Chloroflexi bacterium]|nr:hypothetical protein [Chloroflexota bacterium]MDA1173292.1 hypothetical protein [Chloroflexota bacterium]